MVFDESYYQAIWPEQGVHRHDYCESLADSLVAKYGTVRMLDVGTACGYLVKCLRERGCDAWGTEISDYAIANTCAPGFVRWGDIRSLPFFDHSFDVVHSQGVWGYFPKSDIWEAWAECHRVGKIQHHNIDYDDQDPSHQYLFTESKEWWDSMLYKAPEVCQGCHRRYIDIPHHWICSFCVALKQKNYKINSQKILVACPTHELKEYAMRAWVDKVKSFTHHNFDIFVVDNSPTDALVKRWQAEIPIIHFPVEGGFCWRINASMDRIREHFLAGGYSHWFNMEIDTIPEPVDVIERMLELGKGVDWVSHAYPSRTGNSEEDNQQGIGCSLLSRDLIEAHTWSGAGDNMTPDGWLWAQVRPKREFKTMELWGFWRVRHLNHPDGGNYS